MRRSWILAVAATFALGLGSLANAQSIPPGSYQQTCKNVDFHGDTLAANCQDSSGHWHDASLHDVARCQSDIINDDGSLRCSRGVGAPTGTVAGVPGGAYSQTCRDVRLDGNDLVARCQSASGDWHDAKLDDFNKCHGDIVNDNGKLRCIVTPGYQQPGYPATVAADAYTQTCKDIKSHGDHLEARCEARNGDWHKTSLDDYKGCHGQIINDDGNLRCVAAAGYGDNRYPVAAGYPAGFPGGSYTQSCQDVHIHGFDLEARCTTKGGDTRDTKLENYRECRSEIINDDGHLRCEK